MYGVTLWHVHVAMLLWKCSAALHVSVKNAVMVILCHWQQ